jgi:cell wall-associated NlpC family hydrolase
LLFLPPNKLCVKPYLLKIFFAFFSVIIFASCSSSKKSAASSNTNTSNKNTASNKATTKTSNTTPATNSKAKYFAKPVKIDKDEFIAYAKTYIGTPYKYGSAVPKNGLDCSGYIMVVFAHFNVKTPRVSRDYTNEGTTIKLNDAQAGDLILFTGSDNSTGIVGHIGIVTKAGTVLTFISSTSGKNIGVVEAKLSGYWLKHFVKVIRVLE